MAEKKSKQEKRSKKCLALGCLNNTSEMPYLHFFQLPKNETIRDIWIRFSRRGNEYDVKKYTYLCEEHFDPSCFDKKQKKTFLVKNSIPSIFIRQTPEGTEKTLLTFDQSVLHYVEEDTFLKPVNDFERNEKQFIEKCQKKLREIRDELCRFCFTADCEKLVLLNNLKDYGVNINEMLNFIGLNMQQDSLFSDLACEECFQELVGFDGYRKRCQKAQRDIVAEIKNLKTQLQNAGCEEITTSFKVESPWKNSSRRIVPAFASSSSFESHKLEPEPSFQQIIIKEELKDEPVSDYDYECGNNEFDSEDEDELCIPNVTMKDECSNFTDVEITEKPVQLLKEAKQADSSVVVTNQSQQMIANALYECFSCRVRFAGKKTFQAHICPVKMICPFTDCGIQFSTLGAYVSHIMKMHKLPKVKRKFCNVCKLSWTVSEMDFLEHRKKCSKDDAKAALEKTIECQKCGKICKNIKAYTVHQMFHKQDPTYPKTAEQLKNSKAGVFICETCGESHKTRNQLRQHIRRKHEIAETNPDGTEKTVCEFCGRECVSSYRLMLHKKKMHDVGRKSKKPKPLQTFTCDQCGQQRNSRQAMYDHIRRTHVVQPSPCLICGKVFRVPDLLKRHMMYHDETKRKHFCPMCPGKGPWFTGVALRRHQESNHGMGPGYTCDVCFAVYKTVPALSTHRITVHKIKLR